MASNEQMRPASDQQAPDPSNSYERAHPSRVSRGKMDAPQNPPQEQADGTPGAVKNQTPTENQINAEDTDKPEQEALPGQPDHSMHDEEPTGWDQAPQNIQDPRQKRHPRTEGKGGLE